MNRSRKGNAPELLGDELEWNHDQLVINDKPGIQVWLESAHSCGEIVGGGAAHPRLFI